MPESAAFVRRKCPCGNVTTVGLAALTLSQGVENVKEGSHHHGHIFSDCVGLVTAVESCELDEKVIQSGNESSCVVVGAALRCQLWNIHVCSG